MRFTSPLIFTLVSLIPLLTQAAPVDEQADLSKRQDWNDFSSWLKDMQNGGWRDFTRAPKPTSPAVSSSASKPPATTTSKAPVTTTSQAPVVTTTSKTSASSSAAASSGGNINGGVSASDKQKLLDLHNAERDDYGASPLTWSAELEKAALDYANKCQEGHSGGKYGENLAFSIGYRDVITTGVNGWNNERSDYDYNNPTYSHWTQVVWKGTTQVGCAVVKCPAGSVIPKWTSVTDYVVCEYNPPGNYAGQYGTNVGKRV